MGKTTSEVYDWTQNFWVGCQPVSAGCLHCYARADYQEFKRDNFDKVVRTKTWGNPLSWQKRLAKTGKVERVFTCSWSDFFHPDADQWRDEAWSVIKNTPNLLWQVLTKRAELIADRLPEDWGEGYPNVCLGVTVEKKEYLWRMDTLRKIPAKARYVIAEPLLEDLMPDLEQHVEGFHQIMVGGESGNGTNDFRPMNEQWARNIRDLCAAKHIPFYFKQHSGRYSQIGKKLDGVEHKQYPAAWDTYKPAFQPIGSPCQISVFDGLEDFL
jgi:protein gp37